MRQLFATPLYEAELGDPALLADLAHSIRTLGEDDEAGLDWSEAHRYPGYTSYASLGDLTVRDPAFAELAKRLAKHATAFAKLLAWDHKPRLDSLWVNILLGGGHHAAHIHPHSVLSGTLYVEVPKGAGAIRFEDPRAGLMMAAPVRRDDAPERLRPHIDLNPSPGTLLMWESWLRHEVRPGDDEADERLSVSFNFA